MICDEVQQTEFSVYFFEILLCFCQLSLYLGHLLQYSVFEKNSTNMIGLLLWADFPLWTFHDGSVFVK